jgi:hypothetical protein
MILGKIVDFTMGGERKEKEKEKDKPKKRPNSQKDFEKDNLDRHSTTHSNEFECIVTPSGSSVASSQDIFEKDKPPSSQLGVDKNSHSHDKSKFCAFLPPVKPQTLYVCIKSFQSSWDGAFEVEKGEKVLMLGLAQKTNIWAVIEKEKDQKVGFFPLAFLSCDDEKWSSVDVEGLEAPGRLETRFEIVKPLLDNTPFLRHVGLNNTVKTLKVTPQMSVDEMEKQLTQSVVRGLKDVVQVLIEVGKKFLRFYD